MDNLGILRPPQRERKYHTIFVPKWRLAVLNGELSPGRRLLELARGLTGGRCRRDTGQFFAPAESISPAVVYPITPPLRKATAQARWLT